MSRLEENTLGVFLHEEPERRVSEPTGNAESEPRGRRAATTFLPC